MSRRAFSLVEMIVVLGILTVLLSILMPVVGSARDLANGTLCQSHVRTLTQACIAFAAEHDGHLPGTLGNSAFWWGNDKIPINQDPSHLDWLYGKYAMEAFELTGNTTSIDSNGNTQTQVAMANIMTQLATAPQYGTLWPYVNNGSYSLSNLPDGGSFATYRCPSLTTSIPGSGLGSNGRFDYAIFAIFDGAGLKDIKATSTLHYVYDATYFPNTAFPKSPDGRWNGPSYTYNFNYNWYNVQRTWSTQYEILPTPLVCQEDALHNINGGNMEGQHASVDQMSHLHRGGSYYGSPDGSVNWVNEPDADTAQYWQEGTNLWECVPPSGGTPIALNGDPGLWNWWASQ